MQELGGQCVKSRSDMYIVRHQLVPSYGPRMYEFSIQVYRNRNELIIKCENRNSYKLAAVV